MFKDNNSPAPPKTLHKLREDEDATERRSGASRSSPSEPARVFGRVDARGGGGRAAEGYPEGGAGGGLGALEKRALEESDTEFVAKINTMVVFFVFRGRGYF